MTAGPHLRCSTKTEAIRPPCTAGFAGPARVKALLDEHLSPHIAALLRQAGFDGLAVADRADLFACSDRVIFEAATTEGRAVVTNNIRDFRPLAAEWLATGRTQPGLILLPSARTRTRAAVPALAAAIQAVLSTNPDGIAGSVHWLGAVPN
jgi:predicted nuclease of predicted toxin-antitoxin system